MARVIHRTIFYGWTPLLLLLRGCCGLQTVEEKRKQVLVLCEEELSRVKREYLPNLARKQGVYQEYIKRMKVLPQ